MDGLWGEWGSWSSWSSCSQDKKMISRERKSNNLKKPCVDYENQPCKLSYATIFSPVTSRNCGCPSSGKFITDEIPMILKF